MDVVCVWVHVAMESLRIGGCTGSDHSRKSTEAALIRPLIVQRTPEDIKLLGEKQVLAAKKTNFCAWKYITISTRTSPVRLCIAQVYGRNRLSIKKNSVGLPCTVMSHDPF